jgi:EmrB/QacA subfamily drug resistance transporter
MSPAEHFGNRCSLKVVTGAGTDDQPHGWQRLVVEPRRPAAIRNWPNAPWLVVVTVSIGAFLGQLDASIVTLALPTLQQQFHASLASVEWVALSYLLVLIASVTAVGRLADMIGRKLLYTYGFAIFTLASIGCGLSPSLGVLIGFRVVQALGAAMLQANSVALIATAIPKASLGRAIGIQGAAQATGLALGPTVGGLLIGVAGWRWIFFLNGPVGLVGLVLAWFLLPRSRDLAPRVRFDWVGLGFFGPAVVAVLLALNVAGHSGFVAPVLLLVAAVVLGGAFIQRERRAGAPLIDLQLFRNIDFTAGVASGLLSYLVLFAVLFVVPFFLEHARHLSPTRAGFELGALPIALAIVAPFAGRARDRIGARIPTVTGMVIVAAMLAGLAVVDRSSAAVVLLLAGVGVGLGLFTPANNAAIMAAAPREHSGMAGGILNLTRGLGTAIGVAVTGLILGLRNAERVHASQHVVTVGFQTCVLVLAVVAMAAAGLASLRASPTSPGRARRN